MAIAQAKGAHLPCAVAQADPLVRFGSTALVPNRRFVHAACSTLISTCSPAAATMLTSESRLNSSILSRTRSEMRG